MISGISMGFIQPTHLLMFILGLKTAYWINNFILFKSMCPDHDQTDLTTKINFKKYLWQGWAEHFKILRPLMSSGLFALKKKKKTTAFDFLQKWFIKQFSCLQLQPVGREQKTSWGMFLSPVAPLKYNYLLEEKMVFLWFHRAAITNGTNDRLF